VLREITDDPEFKPMEIRALESLLLAHGAPSAVDPCDVRASGDLVAKLHVGKGHRVLIVRALHGDSRSLFLS
jgi:hypothetical protein